MKVCERNRNGEQGECCVLRVDMCTHSHAERAQACGNQRLCQPDATFICYPSKVTDMSPVLAGQVLKWSLIHLCIDVLRFPPYVVGEYCLLFVAGECLGGRVLAWHKEASTSYLYP